MQAGRMIETSGMMDTPPQPPTTPAPDSRNKPPVRFSKPKPPPLPKRFLLLLVEPEKWAQAVSYPASVTFWPLVWALIISAICMGFSMSARAIKPMKQFAASYDQHFLPMQLNKGELSIIKPAGKTSLVPLNIQSPYETLMVDTSLSGISALKTYPLIALFNRTDLVLTGQRMSQPMLIMPLAQLQQEMLLANGVITPAAAKTTPVDKLPAMRIDAQSLHKFFTVTAPVVVVVMGLVASACFLLAYSGWTVLMIFLTGFLIMSINRNLAMPLKVAWRISMAVMIPLLVLRGLLAVFNVVPAINSTPITDQIIYMAPIGLALWAAVLANGMFSRPRREQSRKP
jgi:hypothetical protein